MSQHRIETTSQGRPVEVLMGWDRILSYYFLTVTRMDVPDDAPDGQETVYTHLDEPDAFPQSLDGYLDKLRELGITVPQSVNHPPPPLSGRWGLAVRRAG